MLASNKSLERLALTHTNVTDAGAQLICNALQVCGCNKIDFVLFENGLKMEFKRNESGLGFYGVLWLVGAERAAGEVSVRSGSSVAAAGRRVGVGGGGGWRT